MIPTRRPLVKICGVTRVEDAEAAAELGADLLGLNFWPGSSRHVTVARATEIARAFDGRLNLVGVFVDATAAEIRRCHDAIGLDLIQLHGDEDPALVHELPLPTLRAFRGLPSMDLLLSWASSAGILIDARSERAIGGTGELWDYSAVRTLPRDGRPLLVAGGIVPGNAAAALSASGADGVDVASGIESAPGIKDHEQMRRLIEEVRSAAI